MIKFIKNCLLDTYSIFLPWAFFRLDKNKIDRETERERDKGSERERERERESETNTYVKRKSAN